MQSWTVVRIGPGSLPVKHILHAIGPLTMEDFATALKQALARDWAPLKLLKMVLKDEDAVEIVRDALR